MNRTSFLDCKHKHMMKSGAPPDRFIVLYRMVTYRIPWFAQAELILRLMTLWFLVLSQFFRDDMGPFKQLCLNGQMSSHTEYQLPITF